MAKNIVICADGTWNRPTVHTNVDRLFNTLPGEPNAVAKTKAIDAFIYRSTPEQVAFYLEGVGARASRNDLLAGATGTGLHDKVLDGYLLVSRIYQPGDKIFLFGFSRGAYTVRSLAGLIAKAGLMQPEKALHEDCRDLANRLWWAFKHQNACLGPNAPDAADPCPIRLVGVWDTVGALGIPLFNGINVVDDMERHLFDFADCNLSGRVAFGLHAMAIDERRLDYVPTPWNPRAGITQHWFPGVHSDVGGGYAAKGLGDCSLAWMLAEAVKPEVGLLATLPPLTPNPLADRHESADSLVWQLRSGPRAIPDDAVFSPCVGERFAKRNDYRPQALARHPVFKSYYTGQTVAEKLCTSDPTAPTRRLEVGQSCQVVVLAEKWWNGSGLTVATNDVYDILSCGTWCDDTKGCNADGWNGLPLFTQFRRVPDKPWFHLCLAVSPDPMLECNNADFFKGLSGTVGRLDSGSTIAPVGLARRVTVAAPGYVYFFANDAPACYGNNYGYLEVTVKRVA